MPGRPLGITLAGVVALLIGAGSAFAFTEVEEARLEYPLAFDVQSRVPQLQELAAESLARSADFGLGWVGRRHVRTGVIEAAWGGQHLVTSSPVRDREQAVSLSRNFLATRGQLLATTEENLIFRNAKEWRGRYVTHFTQEIQGVPVWRAGAWVQLAEDGRLSAFGSSFFPEGHDAQAEIALLPQDAVAEAASALSTTPRTDRPIEIDRYWVPAPVGETFQLVMAYRVLFESEEPFGKWESLVHAGTGEILARRNFYHPINVVGGSEAQVQNQLPTLAYCDGEGTEVLAHMDISVSGGNTGTTDASGNFDISHGGASAVNVTASFAGPYINVNRFTGLGSDASLTVSFVPGVPGTFTFNDGNSRQDERDTFFHGNVIRDFMIDIDGTFTQLDLPVISVVGRTDGLCPGNAWWNIGAGQMNYCLAGSASGTDYANTGELANVVYHEYGHGITDVLYVRNGAPQQPPGGLHEGNSDVVANFLDRNPVIGLGFFDGNCVSGIRNAENGLQYPASNENGGHTAGQVIAGFHWLFWQGLLAAFPQAEADSIAWSSWHYARDLGTPQTFPDQVLWTFLADDDDADLSNGTPHYDFLCAAAEAKGFTCPTITTGVFIDHTPLASIELPSGTVSPEVVATITSTPAALDPSGLKLRYRLDGGAYQELALTATANPDEFSATFPALSVGAQVEYYIEGADLSGNMRTNPLGAPYIQTYTFDVAVLLDELEDGGVGWTAGLGGDTATSGIWELVDPIGTTAQPEDDATADPGTMCFITGQCSGPLCSGCTLGCNDVDNGFTTLLSPVWDLSGLTNVRVKYARWFTNDTGAAPGEDAWVVDVSNDGGSTWTNFENTLDSSPAWEQMTIDIDALFGSADQVQLRFIASDTVNGSLVEAGVDDVRILGNDDSAVDTPVIGAAAPRALELGNAQPNPFDSATSITFALPEAGHVDLAVYNVSGQRVATLVDAARDAGRYDATWNGRDENGGRVSTGVYFYRLTVNGESLTKKMTALK